MQIEEFNFKQFSIQQQDCAMKVGTDGVLLGAWVNTDNVKTVLDIGTGTGLLALMIAQRTNNAITNAIEIESQAARQAEGNILRSPWASNIKVHHCSLADYQSQSLYDLIVCNPPFFLNSLESEDRQRNLARHQSELSDEALIAFALKNLSDSGRLAVILPFDRGQQLLAYIEPFGLEVARRCNVKGNHQKTPNRIMLELGRTPFTASGSDELAVREGSGYTSEYVQLTKDFYTIF